MRAMDNYFSIVIASEQMSRIEIVKMRHTFHNHLNTSAFDRTTRAKLSLEVPNIEMVKQQ